MRLLLCLTKMDRSSYVYMLASGRYGTLYVGVTSDLIKRVWQHREGVIEGFTKRYCVKTLVCTKSMRTCYLPSRAKSKSRSGGECGSSGWCMNGTRCGEIYMISFSS
jgi:hypothetical protein